MEPWQSDLDEFFTLLMNRGACLDIHHTSRITGCRCMESLQITLTDIDRNKVCKYMMLYARMPWKEQRNLILEWKKYGDATRAMMEGQRRSEKCQVYSLPGSTTHKICRNALATLLGKSKFAWENIEKEGRDVHGLAKRETSNFALPQEEIEALHEYLFSLTKLGTPRATKLITDLTVDGTVSTELKDADPDLIELPFCNSKRQLYKSYIQLRGFEVSYDSKSRQTTTSESQPGERTEPIGWPTFCRYWSWNFPKMVIQSPSKDICDNCVVWANKHKFLKKKRIDNEEQVQESGEGPTVEGEQADEGFMLEQEEIVMEAVKHVTMAKEQRLLFNSKKECARTDRSLEKEQEEWVYTYVCDFAQNMNIPNFNAEQPGATYYYSPLKVYPFGIVDCSQEPSQLTARVFYEGEAKKGGNSVASMIWKQFQMDGLRNGKTAKEINLVFDNCTGQNKNRMIIRMLIILVKLKITTTA